MSETTKKVHSDVCLAIDAGGTFFKSSLLDGLGKIIGESFFQTESGSDGPARDIVAAYARSARRALAYAAAHGLTLRGIGIAAPGPFDYARGVSMMKHKFASLCGVNVAEAISQAMPEIVGIPICFRHDANAFLAGEMWRGAAVGRVRAGGVTLGTGVGVACCLDGEFVNNPLGSPAPEVSIWNSPYRDSIVEDCVSGRALVDAYRAVCQEYDAASGAKGVADAAKAGDRAAVEVYARFGADLGEILMSWCEHFKPQIIVFGGQISKDFSLFETALRRCLSPLAEPPELVVGSLGAHAALYGAVETFYPEKGD